MREEEKQQNAFPALHLDGHRGMTLRDYFAAKAMQSLIINSKTWGYKKDSEIPEAIVTDSYKMADAMLKQREL